MLGEGFMVWARAMGLGLGLNGSPMAVLAARQFDGSSRCTEVRRQSYGAFTIYTCLHACKLRARVQLELPWNCPAAN